MISFPRIPEVLVMIIILLAALLLCGCASTQPPEAPETLPQLIYQAPLPPWPYPGLVQDVPLELMIHVASDGSVSSVRLLTPSGNAEWDTLSIATIKQWRFATARVGTRPVSTWIRQKVRVHFEAPSLMVISELVCPDRQLADSLYSMLTLGAPFDSLARVYSVSPSRASSGYLGEIDIRAFPTYIRRQVGNLREGEFTKPLALGENLVIFKRTKRIR